MGPAPCTRIPTQECCCYCTHTEEDDIKKKKKNKKKQKDTRKKKKKKKEKKEKRLFHAAWLQHQHDPTITQTDVPQVHQQHNMNVTPASNISPHNGATTHIP